MSKQIQDNTKTRAKNSSASVSAPRAIATRKLELAPISVLPQHDMKTRLSTLLRSCFEQLATLLKKKRPIRKLKVLELQQLGEKRFIAVVRVGRQKFLIGGASSSVSLLAEIGPRTTTVLAPRPLHQDRA
jgi:hypothetical protein